MRKIIMTLAFAMTFTPVLAQSAAEQSGVNSALNIPPKTEDFVREAAMSDMFEIESSKLATTRTTGAVKSFAEEMITDHQKTSAELKQLLQDNKINVALPTTPSEDQRETINDLTGQQEADFPEQYIEDQVDAHQDAVDLFSRYAAEGDNAQLKAWADKTLPTLKHHLEMAQDLDK